MQDTNSAANLLEALNANKRIMHARIHAIADSLSISKSQLELIAAVHTLQPTTSSALAKYLSLTPGAISQLVESLVKLKWISRKTCPDDRRTQFIKLTPGGSRRIGALTRKREKLIQDVVQEFTPQEIATFLRVQKTITSAFEKLPLK